MLNILPIPANDIIMYMNIAFIGIIVLGALIGFGRGTMKSTFYAIATLLVFVGGWLLMGPISKKLMKFDFTQFSIFIDGVQLTTPIEFAKGFLAQQYPTWDIEALFAEGSYTLELIQGVIGIAFKIVYVLALIILSFTLFWLINGIIWLILRIPLRKVFCKPVLKKNGKKKYKKSFLSRLGGFGIGAVKGLMYTLLIGFILAGLASVSDSLKELSDAGNQETVVIVNADSFTVVELADGENPEDPNAGTDQNPNPDGNQPGPSDSFMEQYGDVLEVISGYRKTVSGKVFGAIKMGKNKTSFDEYIFDTIFSVGAKNGTVKLRNELRTVARAFSSEAVQKIMVDGFDIKKLAELPKDELDNLIDTLSSLETVDVVFPVAIELIAYTDILESAVGEQAEFIKELLMKDDKDALNKLLGIKANDQVKSLGHVFVNVLDLLKDNLDDLSKVDYFNLDAETVKEITKQLSEMDLLTITAPIVVNYLLSSQNIKDAATELGIDLEELKSELEQLEGDAYKTEIENLGNVYEAVTKLGLKMVDGAIDLKGIDTSMIQTLSDAIFTSTIISKAMPVIAPVAIQKLDESLPEEFKGMISSEELKGVDWKTEFGAVLTAAGTLLKTGILDEGADPLKILSEMPDDEFSSLGANLSKSSLITNHLNEVIQIALSGADLGGITLEGLDKAQGEEWNEKEIVSLFKGVKNILNSGIIGAEDPMAALKELTDQTIDDLALNLSNSVFITKNLNSIVEVLMSQIQMEGLTIVGLDKTQGETWSQTELSSLFKSLKVIVNSGIIGAEDPMAALKELTDQTIDDLSTNLSSSLFITKNLNSIIDVVMSNANIEGFEIVGLDKPSDWSKEELSSLFGAFKTILATGLISSDNPVESIKTMSDADINKLSSDLGTSKFFSKNLNGVLTFAITQLDPNLQLEALDETKGETWDETEINSVLTSLKAIVNTGIMDEGADPLQKLGTLENKQIETLSNSLSNSKFMTKNISNLMGMFTKDLGFELAELTQEEWTANEIYSVFKSVSIIASSADAGGNLQIENVLNLSDNEIDVLLESKLLTESLKNILVEQTKPGQQLEILKGVYTDGKDENGKQVYTWMDDKKQAVANTDASGVLTITPVVDANKYIVYKNDCYFTSTVSNLTVDLKTIDTSYTYDAKDTFTVKAITENGELRSAFNAISALEIKDLSGGVDIDLRNVSKKKATLLSSYILTETLIDQIRLQDNDNPNGILEISPDYKQGGKGNWHGEDGELNSIIDALDVALGLSTSTTPVSINALDMNNISIKNIVDNKNTLFGSNILTETIIVELQKLDGEVFKLAKEYKTTDFSIWKDQGTKQGELSVLFDVIGKVIPLPEKGFDIKTDAIDLGKIVKERNEVLKSAVITTTVVDKIKDLNTLITIPEEFAIPTDPSWETDYNLWKNTYTETGTLNKAGELSSLLNSLGIALDIENNPIDINNITEDSISLKNIIDNDTKVFDSEILSATVVNKITELNGTVTIPQEYAADYKVWGKNKTNELIYLLDALSYVVTLPDKGFNIQTNNINLNNIYTNKNEILKSAVLTATIVDKVTALTDVLSIPTKYQVPTTHIWATDYDLWKNTYLEEAVKTTGELDALLNALNYALDLTNNQVTIDGVTVDSIKLKNIIDNNDKVFNSQVLTATVVSKIQGLGENINIPVEYSGDYEIWNKDNSNELVYLLDALGYVVTLPETGFNIDTTNIKLNNVVSNKDEILKSAVLTSTIVEKISALNTVLTIPTDYVVKTSNSWDTDYTLWKNTYIDGVVATRGELDNLLNSLDYALDLKNTQVSIDSVSENSIKLKNIIDNNTEVFKSEVLTATVVTKIQGLDTMINIPKEFNSDYKVWNQTHTNELIHLLDALSYVVPLPESGFNIDTTAIELNSVVTNKDEILKSAVLTSTIVSKISDLNAVLTIPTDYVVKTSNSWDTDYTLWKNTYENDLVKSRGELDNLLNSLDYALDLKNNKVTIDKVSDNSIKLKNIIDNNTEVFKSEVLTATVVTKIQGLDTMVNIPKEFNGDYKVWNQENTNEIIYLLDALNYVVPLPETGFDINTNNIVLNNIILNKDEILKSAILTSTIVDKVTQVGTLDIPADYNIKATNSWETDYTLWKNTYTSGSINSRGELDNLLNSLNYALDLDHNTVELSKVDTNNISLKNIITNNTKVFKSEILTATVVKEIKTLNGTIEIPDEFNGDYKVWNQENTNEIIYLLDALDLSLEIPEKGFNINPDQIDMVKLLNNKDDILKSAILTATIVKEISGLTEGLTIPTEYKITDTKWATGYDMWKNTYKTNTLETRGELSYMLGSIDGILGITASTTPVYITTIGSKLATIYLEDIIDNKDKILHSAIVNINIVDKVRALDGTGISLPKDFKNGYTAWENTYDTNDVVTKEGETSKLLGSLKLVLGLDSVHKHSIDNIEVDKFSLKNITSDANRDNILYSDVLTETIKQKFIALSQPVNGELIDLPNNYDDITSPNYVKWENDYQANGTVLERGELSNLLGAVDLLTPGVSNNTTLNAIEFNFNAIFDTTDVAGTTPQDEVLRSIILSETIITKLTSTLSVPTDATLNLNNANDRSNWYNDYSGSTTERKELANLINSVNKLISTGSDGDKSNLGGIDLNASLNGIVSKFADPLYKQTVLNSYVVSETLRVNVMGVPVFSDGCIDKAFTKRYGSSSAVNDINNWYAKDADGNVLEKELWNLITGASIILGGKSLSNVSNFTIEDITSNTTMKPVLNENLEVTESNVEVMLRSLTIEEIFANLAQTLIDGALSQLVKAPAGGYKWYKQDADKAGVEHDLRTFLESYTYVSKYLMSSSMITLSETEIDELAKGMMISRIFRASAANAINVKVLAEVTIKAQGLDPMTAGKLTAAYKANVLNQARFEGNTKIDAYNNFKADFAKLVNAVKAF